MCNHCSTDPRDRIVAAERALWCLRLLVNQLPVGSEVSADGIGGLISLVHDQLDGAATAIQGYVPRDFEPKHI